MSAGLADGQEYGRGSATLSSAGVPRPGLSVESATQRALIDLHPIMKLPDAA